jgi:Zn-dependent alcohol dehydrogenase
LFVHQWPTRWRERQAQQPLCDWIRKGVLTASEFVTHDFPLEKIADAFAAAREGKVTKCLLRY